MISVLKNKNGFLLGYIEWQILDEHGQFKNNGDYIYIQNKWIHEDFRNTDAFKKLVHLIYIHPYSQESKYVYWLIVRDSECKKILESEERPYISKRKSRTFEKEYIYNKIMGDNHAQM